MATSQMSEVIQHLRRTVLLQDGAGLTDGQLLEGYISRHDQAALAALVRRHGPMVWGVCRRVLRNHEDAEDAFQATFLVLVRKAASIVPREMVANWLYGVAHQTALNARATAARRRERERQVTQMPEPAVAEQDLWADLQPLLDAELSRLPDKYRAVVILCDLEGKTRKEAARQIGVPEGTVAGRLARARGMLAKRLAQRGVALSGGALAAVLSQKVASAGVPLSVVESTITAASLVAAGKAASGAISVKVAALTEGVMKAMLFSRLRAALAVVLILGILATGATVLTCRSAAGQDGKKPTAEKPVEPAAKQEQEKEAFTAWGKEVGGLQAGLGYPPGQHRTYYTGETAKLVVRVRNVSKDAVKFQYLPLFFTQKPPTVVDGGGKPVHFRYGVLDTAIFHVPVDVNLAPGKEIVLGEVELLTTLLGTGTFTVQYERVFGMTAQGHFELDPTLSKLATGKLELEIKAEPPPAAANPGKADAVAPEKVQVPGDVRANARLNKTLLALDKQLWEAAKTGDWKAYDRLLAEDFVGHSALYGRSDKAATVESVKKRRYSDWSIRDVETKEIGKDVVILSYIYSCTVTSVVDGTVEMYRDHRTSLVWKQRDGAWVLVFCQETADTKPPLPKPGTRPGFPNPTITSDSPPAAIEKK
jgi:RNA polymerase sigma factor (sigma-70 family)